MADFERPAAAPKSAHGELNVQTGGGSGTLTTDVTDFDGATATRTQTIQTLRTTPDAIKYLKNKVDYHVAVQIMLALADLQGGDVYVTLGIDVLETDFMVRATGYRDRITYKQMTHLLNLCTNYEHTPVRDVYVQLSTDGRARDPWLVVHVAKLEHSLQASAPRVYTVPRVVERSRSRSRSRSHRKRRASRSPPPPPTRPPPPPRAGLLSRIGGLFGTARGTSEDDGADYTYESSYRARRRAADAYGSDSE